MIPQLLLKPRKEERVLAGSLWVFRNELDLAQKDYAPGSLVRVCNSHGKPLALGFINTRSTIAVRLLAKEGEFGQEPSLDTLLEARLQQALRRRAKLFPGFECLRLVFGEADFLPGLVVDRYGKALVLQVGALGIEEKKDLFVSWLRKNVPDCRVILERSEGFSREKEGLSPSQGILWKDDSLKEKELQNWQIKEGDLLFEADLLHGQKTGFYLDQRETRQAAEKLAKELRCLNAFCYSGAFSLALSKGGARSVLGLDASVYALQLARRNAELNHFEKLCLFETADVFQRLREMETEKQLFDLVVLDPPTMSKGKDGLENALRGYKELNYRALKLLPPGGLLVSCSCTQAVDEERFLGVLTMAAKDAGCHLRQVYRGGQPADHPVLLGMPETKYLKAFIFEKA